jgi:hypothetical protein
MPIMTRTVMPKNLLSGLVILSVLMAGGSALAQIKVPSPKTRTDLKKIEKPGEKDDEDEAKKKADDKAKKKKKKSNTGKTLPKETDKPAADSPASKVPTVRPKPIDNRVDVPKTAPAPKKVKPPAKDAPEDRVRKRPVPPPGSSVPKPGTPPPDQADDQPRQGGGGGGGGCCGCGMCFGALCPCADCDWRCEVGGIAGAVIGGILGAGAGILVGYSITFWSPTATQNTVMLGGFLVGGITGAVVGGVTGASLGMLSSGLNPANLFSGLTKKNQTRFGLQDVNSEMEE